MAQTPLYEYHVAAGARFVDFAGWQMPIHYGSQVEEHLAVRAGAGMFDVSHMTVVDLSGMGAYEFLRRLLVNDVARLTETGAALYSVMANESGGIVDDLIVYRRNDGFRLIVNAGTRDKDLAWIERKATGYDVSVHERRDLAILAVQGPRAVAAVAAATGLDGIEPMAPFTAIERDGAMYARTGYTGEDGIEIVCPGAAARELWRSLVADGIRPAGLGARDTLRVEAGLNLYGQDMDETTSPLVSNLGWTVAWQPEDRDFIGRAALEGERDARPASKLTGVVMEVKGVMRHDCAVNTNAGPGVVTSGIFSPSLGYSIGLARLPRAAKGSCSIEIRGRSVPGRIVKPPFVRRGEQVYE